MCAIGERDQRSEWTDWTSLSCARFWRASAILEKLAELSHPRILAGREQIAKSLEGNWRPELLFVLKQEMEMYDTYQHKIAECDRELEATLKQFAAPRAGIDGATKDTQRQEDKADPKECARFQPHQRIASNHRSGP